MDYATESVYSGSQFCPKCNDLMTPLEVLYSGDTGLCVECRNLMYKKHAKSAMGGGSRGER